MIDGIKEPPINFHLSMWQKLPTIKVLANCHRCGKPLILIWDDDLQLNGDWNADDADWSEIWGAWLPVFNSLVCRECWVFGLNKP
jgi:hypothetical protein